MESKHVHDQSAQSGQKCCTGADIAVIILMELDVTEPVAAFNAPAVPNQLQQGFWRGSQAGEKEVPLEGRLSGTLAADDQFDDPAAAGPGLGDEIRSLFGPECPGGLAPMTVL